MTFEGDQYDINYAKAASDTKLLSVTRMLAKDMMENPYIAIGKFIQSISDGDIQSLMNSIEDGYPNQYEDMVIISEMLANGEGCDEPEEANDRISQLTMFLVMESLGRKGLVKVYHENMSFHSDYKDKIVVEKI
jgi:hypothetical protein